MISRRRRNVHLIFMVVTRARAGATMARGDIKCLTIVWLYRSIKSRGRERERETECYIAFNTLQCERLFLNVEG